MSDRVNYNLKGFSLPELIVAILIITLLGSLSVLGVRSIRASADSTLCLSHLREMGTAFTLYFAEHRGRLPHYMSLGSAPRPEGAYYGYWTGILDNYGVRGGSVLCPVAAEPVPTQIPPNYGFGDAGHAWSGKYSANGSALRFNTTPSSVYLTPGSHHAAA